MGPHASFHSHAERTGVLRSRQAAGPEEPPNDHRVWPACRADHGDPLASGADGRRPDGTGGDPGAARGGAGPEEPDGRRPAGTGPACPTIAAAVPGRDGRRASAVVRCSARQDGPCGGPSESCQTRPRVCRQSAPGGAIGWAKTGRSVRPASFDEAIGMCGRWRVPGGRRTATLTTRPRRIGWTSCRPPRWSRPTAQREGTGAASGDHSHCAGHHGRIGAGSTTAAPSRSRSRS